jgi:hypothetical protein
MTAADPDARRPTRGHSRSPRGRRSSSVPSATAIGRATGLSLPTVCELLAAGYRFVQDPIGHGFIAPPSTERRDT